MNITTDEGRTPALTGRCGVTNDETSSSFVLRPSSLVVIVGPTAAGKTALSIDLAEAVGGEIVSADSRQIYRGMDIGTAKVTAAERARVPHHLLDVVTPDQVLSLAEYQALAYAAIAGIQAAGGCLSW